MRTGKELILATKEFAIENRWKSWFHLLTAILLLMIFIVGAALNFHPVIRIISCIFIWLLNARLFMIYHDFLHHAILNRSITAKVIMSIFGWYILAPVTIWKRSHDHHHKNNSKLFTASIGSYPIMTKRKFMMSDEKERKSYLMTRHPLTIAFGYFTIFFFGMCWRSFITNPKRHFDSLIALMFHIGMATLIFIYGGVSAFLFAWFIPFLLTGALGSYLFYAQHNFAGVTFKENADWSYDFAALASSSYFKMSKLMHWFTGNIGYHHVHHLNARIPFYKLPEAFKKIPELQTAKIVTWRWSSIRECLRLKLYDSDEKRMIGLEDLDLKAS